METPSIKNIITTTIVILSFIGGVLAFDGRYARSADIDRVDKKIGTTEITLVKILEQFKADMKKEDLEKRFITLTDQAMQFKLLIRKNPNDVELREDYKQVEIERQEIKRKLENNR